MKYNTIVREAKKGWIDEIEKLHTFSDRYNQLCSWTRSVYNARKVVFFYHSEHKNRYTIHKAIGIQKSTLSRFEFYQEKFIFCDNHSKNPDIFYGSLPLSGWHWFKDELKSNFKKSGMNRILPFWSGNECLGGLVFRTSGTNNLLQRETFEAAASDFAHLLEIAFVQRLLKREAWEKKVILEVGKKISQLHDLTSLLNLIIDSIKEVIHYDAAGIFLLKMPEKTLEYTMVRGYPENVKEGIRLKVGKGIVGWAIENGQEINVFDVRKDRRYILARKKTRSQLTVPIIYGTTVMGAFVLESDKVHFFRYHDLELLRAFAAQTAIVLENSKLLYKALQATQLQKELEIARGIQKALLPKKLPEVNGYDFAAVNQTSMAIGGDLYDFVTLSRHELGVAIGDISGKGVPGALLMATLYATFRGLARRSAAPYEVLKRLNTSLYDQTEADKFATFFYGILDCKKNTFRYSNAGHNPPLLFRANGEWQELQKGGSLLGILSNRTYLSDKITLVKGDVLFFYTDGVTEIFNAQEEEFGVERILEILKRFNKPTAAEIMKKILSEIHAFSQKSSQDDDITIIVIKKI